MVNAAWALRVGAALLGMRMLQRYTLKHFECALRRLRRPSLMWVILIASHWMYLCIIYDVILFRIELLKSFFPRLVGTLQRMGTEQFVLADQCRPCVESHPEIDCHRNAFQLCVGWWQRVLPMLMGTQLLFHVMQRGTVRGFAILKVLKLALFFFGSSGFPGYLFCLTKKLHPCGHGTRKGSVTVALIGALSLTILDVRTATRLVNSLYVSTTGVALIQGVSLAFKTWHTRHTEKREAAVQKAAGAKSVMS